MYCLECGTKVEEGQEVCPGCGMSVAEMRDRLGQASERALYGEEIAPEDTKKLPLVKDRTYTDSQGNPLDPKEPVRLDLASQVPDLDSLPVIGAKDDLFMTMPIQRIVDENARVIADADLTVRKYEDKDREPRNFTVPLMVICVLEFLVIAVMGYFLFI